MAKFGVSIVKTVSFRGVQQEFSNRYHYEGNDMTSAQATQLAQNVAAQEKVYHANDISFLRYSVWLDTGSKATSTMINQGSLSGVGSRPAYASVDRERAYLGRWRAGNDSRGRPVYLRKWFHLCAEPAGLTLLTGVLQNTAGFSTADQVVIAAMFNSFNTLSDGSDAKVLTGPPGRARTGTAEAHKYLEHHQLGDMWRG